jgi:lipopolysaccharide export LptBFGC system permease protein LptF
MSFAKPKKRGTFSQGRGASLRGRGNHLQTYLRRFSPSLYTARLFARIILEVCLLALLIEALYLSERFIHVLEMIIDQPIGLANLVPLLGWTAPEVHLALPIALLIAVYRVILRCREQREFIVLASSGQSILPLVQVTTVVALMALLFSLLISGAVYPYAKFEFRSDIYSIRYQALRGGSAPGQFLFFPDYTMYVWPSDKAQVERPIFVKQIVDEKTYRIINAKRIELVDGQQTSQLLIRMLGVTVNDFPNVNELWVASEPEREADSRDHFCNGCGIKTLRAVSLIKELKLAPLEPRGITLDEWTTPELLGLMSAPSGRDVRPDTSTEAVRRFARSLLCFLAPFLAWSTLTFTRCNSEPFALPVACVLLTCGDIGFSQVISTIAPGNAGILAAALVGVTVALVVYLVRQVVARQHLVVFPALARS